MQTTNGETQPGFLENFLLVTPLYILKRSGLPRRRHLMAHCGLVRTSKVDEAVASHPHDPNMALGDSVTVLHEIVLQDGPNGLNILPAGLQGCPEMVMPYSSYDIRSRTPEVNLDINDPSSIHVGVLHIPPNQNAPPIGLLVPVEPGSHVLVISDGTYIAGI